MTLVDAVAAPVADPAGETADDELGAFKLGTDNGSDAQPSAVAALLTDVVDAEQGVSVRPVPPGLACVAPVAAEEGTALLGAELTCGLTWARAASKAANHRIITKMNIRSIALSYFTTRRRGSQRQHAHAIRDSNTFGSVAFPGFVSGSCAMWHAEPRRGRGSLPLANSTSPTAPQGPSRTFEQTLDRLMRQSRSSVRRS